jgi:PTH1 family peptidyl-tRNA hydrolase
LGRVKEKKKRKKKKKNEVRILLGIGNPERRYSLNRHNIGFMLLDYFAQTHSISFKASKFDYYFAQGEIFQNPFLLVKPTTYVNNCGVAALQALNNYETDINDFLVVVDDLNLGFSKIRIRKSGGDGGHNGINSIIFHLQSDQFPRLRIGIGNYFAEGEMTDYVLTDFNEEERKVLSNTFKLGATLLEEFISGGLQKMLDANSRLLHVNVDNKNELNKSNEN